MNSETEFQRNGTTGHVHARNLEREADRAESDSKSPPTGMKPSRRISAIQNRSTTSHEKWEAGGGGGSLDGVRSAAGREILGYVATHHFERQMLDRGIDGMLVSLCLAKGRVKRTKNPRVKVFTADQRLLGRTVDAGYLEADVIQGVLWVAVVAKNRRLITTYLRRGDVAL